MYYKVLLSIGVREKDPNNRGRKRTNYKKGRTLVKWYRAQDMAGVTFLVNKTRWSKYHYIKPVQYKDYIKGVEKHHEY